MGKGLGRSVTVYVRALGISSLRIVGPRGGRPIRLLNGELSPRPAPYDATTICNHCILWACSASAAQMVAACARPYIEAAAKAPAVRGWLDVSHETARESVLRAASELGVILESNETVQANAVQAIATIDRQLADLKQAGDLSTINKSYREYRLAQGAAGKKAMPYAYYIWNYKLTLIKVVAQATRLFDRQAFGLAVPR
jgi:hypothetical protein